MEGLCHVRKTSTEKTMAPERSNGTEKTEKEEDRAGTLQVEFSIIWHGNTYNYNYTYIYIYMYIYMYVYRVDNIIYIY